MAGAQAWGTNSPRRQDLGLDSLQLSFNEPVITAGEVVADLPAVPVGHPLTEPQRLLWIGSREGKDFSDAHPKGNYFTWQRCARDRPFPTLLAFETNQFCHWTEPRRLNDMEIVRAQTFPDDYDFGELAPIYVCGMSVPPRMMQRLATQIAAWLTA